MLPLHEEDQEVLKSQMTSDIQGKTGDASVMKLSLLTRPSLTHLNIELAVPIKAKEMDPFGRDLLAANDKVQS